MQFKILREILSTDSRSFIQRACLEAVKEYTSHKRALRRRDIVWRYRRQKKRKASLLWNFETRARRPFIRCYNALSSVGAQDRNSRRGYYVKLGRRKGETRSRARRTCNARATFFPRGLETFQSLTRDETHI